MKFDETKENITLHGLGFLQLKLGGNQRLHVWHPELPRRSCHEFSSIHDHRFGFESRVLVGTQINKVFTQRPHNIAESPTHMAYLHEGPRTKYGNRPWIEDKLLIITFQYEEVVEAGQTYTMKPYVYHNTTPGGNGMVATLMTKTEEHEHGAHSLCRIGHAPDVNFDRKQWPESRLWAIVHEVLGSVI